MYSELLNNICKETALEAIHTWESEVEEGFTDYFDSNVNIPSLMFWCLGKGYLSTEKFDLWLEDRDNSLSECLSGYEVDFALFPTNDFMSEKTIDKLEEDALKVLAEFICSNKAYRRRFIKFLAGCNWSTEWEDIEGETNAESLSRAIEILKSKR